MSNTSTSGSGYEMPEKICRVRSRRFFQRTVGSVIVVDNGAQVREERERKARERAAMQPALDCETCGALTPGERFRYFADQIICKACRAESAEPSALGAASASPAPQRMRELRRLPRSRGTGHGA